MTVTTESQASVPALCVKAGQHVWVEGTKDWEYVQEVEYAGGKVLLRFGPRRWLVCEPNKYVEVTV